MDVADPKQRTQRNRRRQRAARMHKQAAAAAAQAGQDQRGSADEGDDESPTRQKAHRPPTRKKRIKEKNEPLMEEDIIDGFSILSFKTYEDLEMSVGGTLNPGLNFGVVKNIFDPKIDTGQWKDSPRVGLTPCDHREPNSVVIETNLKIVENNNRVSPEPHLNNSMPSAPAQNRLSPSQTTQQQSPANNNHINSTTVAPPPPNKFNQPPGSPASTQYRPSATVSNSSKPKIMTNQPAPGIKVPVATRAVKTESKRPESPSAASTGQAVSSDPPTQGSSSYSSQSAATPTTPLAASTVVKSEQREETKTGNAASAAVSTTGGQLPTARSLSPKPAQVDQFVNRNHVLVRHPVNKILPNARDESSEEVKCAVVFPGQANKEEVVEEGQSPPHPPPTLQEEAARQPPPPHPICNGTRAQPRPTAPVPPNPAPNNNNNAPGHLSDVSSRSSSGRGYMCDSESDDDRVCLKSSKLIADPSAPVKMSIDSVPMFLEQGSDADGSSDLFNTSGTPVVPVSIKREPDTCPRLNDTMPPTTTADNPRSLAPQPQQDTPSLLATPPTTPPPLGPPLVLAPPEKSPPQQQQPPILLENGPKLEPAIVPLVPPNNNRQSSNTAPVTTATINATTNKTSSRSHWNNNNGPTSESGVVVTAVRDTNNVTTTSANATSAQAQREPSEQSPLPVVVPPLTVASTNNIPVTTTAGTTTTVTLSPSSTLSAIDSPRDNKHSLATVLGNAIAPVTLSSSSDSNSSIPPPPLPSVTTTSSATSNANSAVTPTKTLTNPHQIFSPATSLDKRQPQLSPGPMGPLSFLGGVRDARDAYNRAKDSKPDNNINSISNNFTNIPPPPVINSAVTPPSILPYSGGHLVNSLPTPGGVGGGRSDRSPILPFHSVSNHLTGYTSSSKKTVLGPPPGVGSNPVNGPLASLPPPPPAPLYSPLSPHPYPRPASSSPLLSGLGPQSSVPPKTGYIAPPPLSTVPLALSSSPILPNLVPMTNNSSSVITGASTAVTRTDTSPNVNVTGSGTPVPASTTPTPSMCSGRDSHSAHSSSSISSLSQLSQSLGHSSGHKENGREGSSGSSSSGGRSRSSSRNNTPCVSSASSVGVAPPPPPLSSINSSSSAIVPNCTTVQCSSAGSYTSSAYGSAGLTSLVFSKSSWVSSSANPILSSLNGAHLTPPLPTRPTPPPANQAPPPSLPLPPSLHNSHHSSPYGPHHPGAPPPPPTALHPGGPGSTHPSIFAPPIPPPSSSLTSLGPSPTGAPFSAESLFSQQNTDLLRRELDTRFLASQDRSIAIPPPPYMRTEMHQHQHTHMHQHGPFLPPHPPSLSASSSSMPTVVQPPPPQPGPPAPPPPSHLPFDKFPKLPDSPFFGRNSLGLPGYPPMGPILGPPGASSGTPFTPAGHLAAFQPKLNPLVKNKNMKSGRWCAMHVRIAWEIYHHQHKQSDGHKPGNPLGNVPGKSPADLLRPPGGGPGPGGPPGGPPPPHSLFPSLAGRSPHDISALSSSLLAASAGNHARQFEPHHNSFLSPSAAHLSVSPYARPGTYPTFGPPPGAGFGGLGSLGLTGPSLFGGRDPRSCLSGPLSGPPGSVDSIYGSLHHRTPPSGPFPPPPSSSASSVGGPGGNGAGGGASWGGLKAEAERERERMQREEQEREQREREREQQRIREEKQREQREKEQQRLREEKQRQEKEQMEKERERREQERQKERDRENRLNYQQQQQHLQQQQQQQQQHHLHNGDLMMERMRDPRDHHREHWEAAQAQHRSNHRERERERERDRKERSSLNRSGSSNNSSAFDNNGGGTTTSHSHDHHRLQQNALSKPEVKVKEEKKDDDIQITPQQQQSQHHQQQQQQAPPPPHHHTQNHSLHDTNPPGSDYLRSLQQRGSPASSISAAMNLTHSLDRVRLMRSLPPLGPPVVESHSPHSQVPPHFWGPLGPGGPPTANGNDLRDAFRNLEYQHHQQQQQARDMREREFLQRYAGLGSVVGPPHHHPSHDRYREAEFARHLVAAGDLDRQIQYERSKLGPPPLRTNELAPSFPSALSSVFPSMSMVPRLGGLGPPHPGPPLGLPLRGSKNGSPSSSSTGIPPPLIPCTGGGGGGNGPVPNQGTSPPMLNHKLGLSNPGSLLDNDSYYGNAPSKDRRGGEMAALHPEIDSQSR